MNRITIRTTVSDESHQDYREFMDPAGSRWLVNAWVLVMIVAIGWSRHGCLWISHQLIPQEPRRQRSRSSAWNTWRSAASCCGVWDAMVRFRCCCRQLTFWFIAQRLVSLFCFLVDTWWVSLVHKTLLGCQQRVMKEMHQPRQIHHQSRSDESARS